MVLPTQHTQNGNLLLVILPRQHWGGGIAGNISGMQGLRVLKQYWEVQANNVLRVWIRHSECAACSCVPPALTLHPSLPALSNLCLGLTCASTQDSTGTEETQTTTATPTEHFLLL